MRSKRLISLAVSIAILSLSCMPVLASDLSSIDETQSAITTTIEPENVDENGQESTEPSSSEGSSSSDSVSESTVESEPAERSELIEPRTIEGTESRAEASAQEEKVTQPANIVIDPIITQAYMGLFGQEPTDAELTDWRSQLQNGRVTLADFFYQLVRGTRFDTIASAKGDQCVAELYQAVLGRQVDDGGFDLWNAAIESGSSRFYVLQNLLASPEYTNRISSLLEVGVQQGSYTSDQARDINPNVSWLVKVLYEELLERTPDEGGMNTWCHLLINQNMSYPQVIKSFTDTPEFISKGYGDNIITQLYTILLHRTAEEGNIWQASVDNGMSKDYAIWGIANAPEFVSVMAPYGVNTTNITLTQNRDKNPNVTTFVTSLYRHLLGRNGDPDGLNVQTGALLSGTPGKQIAASFALGPEMVARNLNNTDYVTALYNGILQRTPDEGGLNLYVNMLNTGTSREAIFNMFADSPEFQNNLKALGLYTKPTERILNVSWVSQYTPVFAPWGCAVASMAMLLNSKGVNINLQQAMDNLPMYPQNPGGQMGNVYTGVGFGWVITPGTLTDYARTWYPNAQNISGASVETIKDHILDGNAVLYYGYSSYQKAGDTVRNHCKVITGYRNGQFLVFDPLYYTVDSGPMTGGKNAAYDKGAQYWVSAGELAAEYGQGGAIVAK